MEGRLVLLEARQMLDSQQLWALKAELPPEVIKALSDVELHVQHDIEQEDRIRDLSQTVALLQQRLANLEMLLQDKVPVEAASSTRIPVMQVQPVEVASKPAPRSKKKTRKQPVARTTQ
jgi:hypothetical protein